MYLLTYNILALSNVHEHAQLIPRGSITYKNGVQIEIKY